VYVVKADADTLAKEVDAACCSPAPAEPVYAEALAVGQDGAACDC
jgi:hypothetical protein